MVFKRKIYQKLVEWKKETNGTRALLIEGARRIGKSTVVEEFGKHEYRSYILIDFSIAFITRRIWIFIFIFIMSMRNSPKMLLKFLPVLLIRFVLWLHQHILHAIWFTHDIYNMGMMEQPVLDRISHDIVRTRIISVILMASLSL